MKRILRSFISIWRRRLLELDLLTLKQEDYFCFFGAWHRPENSEGLAWFLTEVLPETPGLTYVIIGPNLPESIKTQIRGSKQVTYLGFVDNPYEYLGRSRALIAPLFKGAGVKVKVVEALCCGTPVSRNQRCARRDPKRYREYNQVRSRC